MDLVCFGKQLQVHITRYASLQKLLNDIASFCPISSDLVECVSGLVLQQVHQFRGKMRHTHSSAQNSLLTSVVRGFKAMFEMVRPYFLPSNAGYIVAMVGDRRNRKNAYEAQSETDRLRQAQKRKFRKLTGHAQIKVLVTS